MKEYFSTKEAAEDYKQKHQLSQREPEYIPFRNAWALVFPIPAKIEK